MQTTKTYKDICITKEELENKGYTIQNSVVEKLDLRILGHFNNIAVIYLVCDCCVLFSGYNSPYSIKDILKCIIEVLDLTDDDGVFLSSIKNVPIRLVVSENSKVIGFGNIQKNKFVLIKDVLRMAKENYLKRTIIK